MRVGGGAKSEQQLADPGSRETMLFFFLLVDVIAR